MLAPAPQAPPARVIPARWLGALALGPLRFQGVEWRILSLILAVPEAPTAAVIARSLNLDYAQIKRAIRGLIAFHVLERRAEGLVFQPDYRRWGPPDVAMTEAVSSPRCS